MQQNHPDSGTMISNRWHFQPVQYFGKNL